ncbi:Uncharacterised protein [Mycobacteroides abscessus subsp. abscessus]|nr:Uncharacterised protein [Mycobacteroides abscessus subsp. abscessus]
MCDLRDREQLDGVAVAAAAGSGDLFPGGGVVGEAKTVYPAGEVGSAGGHGTLGEQREKALSGVALVQVRESEERAESVDFQGAGDVVERVVLAVVLKHRHGRDASFDGVLPSDHEAALQRW